MSSNSIRLLIATGILFALGFVAYPLMYDIRVEQDMPVVRESVKTEDDGIEDDWVETVDEVSETPVVTTVEKTDESRRKVLAAQNDDEYAEEDVPEDPRQKKVPETRIHAQYTSSLAHVKRIVKILEKEDKKPEEKKIFKKKKDLMTKLKEETLY